MLFPLALFHISVCSGMTASHQPWQRKVGTYQCELSPLKQERDYLRMKNTTVYDIIEIHVFFFFI